MTKYFLIIGFVVLYGASLYADWEGSKSEVSRTIIQRGDTYE